MATSEVKQTKQQFKGTVVSAMTNQTIVVKVDTLKKHEKYGKSYRVSRKYHVHDEKGLAKEGDTVEFVACRPLSATKRWRISQVIKAQK